MKPGGEKEILKLFERQPFLPRQRRANPSFCGDEMQDKTDPEGDAEEFMGRQA